MNTLASLCVRYLIRRDLADVSEFSGWSADQLARAVSQSSVTSQVCADERGAVLGWMIYSDEKTHLLLVDLVVREGCRRRGVGSRLLAAALGRLSPRRRSYAEAYVDGGSLDAHLFLKARGFRGAVAGEDVYLFRYEMPECGGR